MGSKLYAVIAGAGPGTGAAVARKFAAAYSVVVLARRAESYVSLVSEINASGGFAIGIPTDVSNADSIANAFQVAEKELGKDASCAVSIVLSFYICVYITGFIIAQLCTLCD